MLKIKRTTSLFYIFLFISFLSYSQNLSYGVLLGGSLYDIEIKGDITAGTAYSNLNYGAFAEYNFNESIGVRLNLLFNTAREKGYSFSYNDASYSLFSEAELSTFQVHGLVKYDVNKAYRKGFYVIGGLRFTSISEIDSEVDLDDFYEKNNFGVLLGFGTTFLKHFSIEFLADYNITDTIDVEDNKASNLGAYANLLIHLESIFKKQ